MQVILCHSAKGGTGKTTLALNLAKSLVQIEKKVCICDFDITGPSLNFVLPQDPEPQIFLNDYLLNSSLTLEHILHKKSLVDTKDIILNIIYSNPRPSEPKTYVQLLKLLGMSPEELVPRFKKFLFELAKTQVDYLILDNATGVNQLSLMPLLFMNIGLIILRPNIYGQTGTKSILKEAYLKLQAIGSARQDLYLILNFIPDNANQKQQKMIAKWKQEYEEAFKIPIVDTFNCYCREWEIDGEEYSIWFPEQSQAAEKVKQLAEKIIARTVS